MCNCEQEENRRLVKAVCCFLKDASRKDLGKITIAAFAVYGAYTIFDKIINNKKTEK